MGDGRKEGRKAEGGREEEGKGRKERVMAVEFVPLLQDKRVLFAGPVKV